MTNDSLMSKNVTFIFVVRRIKTLGIAITIGIIIIFLMGLLVALKNTNADFEIINLFTLIILIISIPLSFVIRINLLKKVNIDNFIQKYFNAHIIPFSIIDFTGLLCITTNLFVNGNIYFATFGTVTAVAGMLLNFPKENFFEEIKK